MNYYVEFVNLHAHLCVFDGVRHQSFEDLEKDITRIVNKANELQCKPYILFMDVTEGRTYVGRNVTDFLETYEFINSRYGQDYSIGLDAEYEEISEIPKLPNVFYSDFLVIPSYVNTFMYADQEVNTNWNSIATKGLWTPGRMGRPHRALLVSKLWEQQILQTKLQWSCFSSPSNIQGLQSFLPNYDANKFEGFIKEISNSLDIHAKTDTDLHITGFPFDVNLYKNTSFSVITETDFHGHNGIETNIVPLPKITEKTYRSIVNKHPFIQVWYPGMLEKLKSKGYKTFEEYMIYPDYHRISDLDKRLDAAVKNIKFFHGCISKKNNVDKVRDDVEHNYNTLMSHVKRELKKFDHIFKLPQIREYRFHAQKLTFLGFPRKNEYFNLKQDWTYWDNLN